MKSLRLAGISALMILCVGMALGQDAAHETIEADRTLRGHRIPALGAEIHRRVGYVNEWAATFISGK